MVDLGPVGITCEHAGARISALSCPVAHTTAVPVDDVAGQLVAWLCPTCDRQLPADWKPKTTNQEQPE
jgi:hypothetical protein